MALKFRQKRGILVMSPGVVIGGVVVAEAVLVLPGEPKIIDQNKKSHP